MDKHEPHSERHIGEGAVRSGKELVTQTEAGKKELVGDQRREMDRLKNGGRSGITNEFGKPVLIAEAAITDTSVQIAQAALDGGADRQISKTNSSAKAYSGEISKEQGVGELISAGHSVKFSLDAHGNFKWTGDANWQGSDWNQQNARLQNYLASHPEEAKQLAADIRKNGGSLTLSGEVDDSAPHQVPPHRPPHQGGADGTDRQQHFCGSGNIEGRQVSIGGPNDVLIAANSPDGTPISVNTTDGGQVIRGRLVTVQGQKYFCPEMKEDSSGRHAVADPRHNLIPLRAEGSAVYAPYERM